MAVSSEQPLCPTSDADLESIAVVYKNAAPMTAATRYAIFSARAVIVLALTALAAVLMLAPQAEQPAALLTEDTAGGIVSLDSAAEERQRHVQITYGLFKATCPSDTSDKSEGAKVTLDSIKALIGAGTADDVGFWWVYPRAKDEDEDDEDWSPESQFESFGGYLYQWGDSSVCLALTPKGSALTMAPSEDFPQGAIDWHKPVGPGIDKLFAWIPPTKDATCKHGCFVYKATDGEKSVYKVI